MNKAFLTLVTALFLSGCSTELEVNAPYKNIHVMYGLLNLADSIQYIKVNKGFLGEGDALVYAQIPDSSELDPEQISHRMVYKVNPDGARVDSFPLKDTLITDRLPGTFYYPEQRLYYFTENQTYPLTGNQTGYLEQNATYEIEMTVRGEQLSASTTIVNELLLGTGSPLSSPELGLYTPTQGYLTPELKWSIARDGKRYQLEYRFKYREEVDGVATEKVLERTIGTTVAPNSQANGQMTMAFSGQEFYQGLANAIPPAAPNMQRIFTGIDFLFTVANDDFHTYLTLSEPVSGIVQDRVEYSNIVNGYGIFGSRYTKTFPRFLNGASLTELMTGQYTGNRGFCYQQGEDAVQCP